MINLAAKEHKKNKEQLGFFFVEALLTGRHEIMKTGRKRVLSPSRIPFHVFMFSC
jgi:hypothetical protein